MIERSSAFKRDYKRIRATPRYKKDFEMLISKVLEHLIADVALPQKYLDHSLSGDWSGYRECHLKPDLLLIYKKPDQFTLRLARLGSHNELFS